MGDYKEGCRLETKLLLSKMGISTQYREDNIFMLLNKGIAQTGKGDETIANTVQPEVVTFKDINFIIFPDWSQSEDSLCLELERVIRVLANHPDKSWINLFVDISNISDEDANLFISSIAMNLMMQEDLDVTDGPEISLVGNFSEVKWENILHLIHARIILENENQDTIASFSSVNVQAEANKILSYTLDSLSSQQTI